jgi:hypothetical protein
VLNPEYKLEALIDACRSEDVSEDDIRRLQDVLNIVDQAGVVGLTINELKARVANPRPEQTADPSTASLRLGLLVRLLCSYQQLWAVGNSDLRYVSASNVEPWLVKTFRLTRLDKENLGNLLQELKGITANREVDNGLSSTSKEMELVTAKVLR